MLRFWLLGFSVALLSIVVWAQSKPKDPKAASDSQRGNWQPLSKEAARVVEGCGTEPPFSGKFLKHKADGTYQCTRCKAPLFQSGSKFESGSGWPSFDDAIVGAVKEVRDADGRRTEIQCARCGGHLGHVFRGEQMTQKNTRHCVNSLSLDFSGGAREEAFFAGGCFWGVEHLLESLPGVLDVQSGYMGGRTEAPSYRDVSTKGTGHVEVVRVRFDPSKISFKTLAMNFFEIHDPTQVDRQGPDVGEQYRSAVFATGEAQSATTKGLIAQLKAKGLKVVTAVEPAAKFWPAEDYHQDYYKRTGKQPYCHMRVKRF